jgi:hypothetical protein
MQQEQQMPQTPQTPQMGAHANDHNYYGVAQYGSFMFINVANNFDDESDENALGMWPRAAPAPASG